MPDDPGSADNVRTKLPNSFFDSAMLSFCALAPLLPSRSAAAIASCEYSAKIGTRVSNSWRRSSGGVRREIHSSWEMTQPSKVEE